MQGWGRVRGDGGTSTAAWPVGWLGTTGAGAGTGAVAPRAGGVRCDAGRVAGAAAQPTAGGYDGAVAGADRAPIRRVHDAFPWSWTASDVEDWTSSLLSRNGHAHSTIRSYQGAVACFLDYVVDARYGWAAECEARFGTHPVQICHEWNTAVHVADYEGRPGSAAVHPRGAAGVLRLRRRPGGRRPGGWPQGLAGGVSGRNTIQSDLRLGIAPAGVGDAGRGRLHHQSGGSAVGSVRHAGGALRQGDARVTPAAAASGDGDAVGGRGGRGVRERRPALLRRRAGIPALFLTERGERISLRQVDERFAVYRAGAGLPDNLTPHCLRHSYISHLIEDGVDPTFVQCQAGHSWASTTAGYTTVGADHANRMLRAAVERAFVAAPQGGSR